jgi:transcriptional regulator with XRE-family HTH domain
MPGARSIARRVGELRRQLGWSAQQLADACAEAGMPALSRSIIAKIESGVRKGVSAEEAVVLARVLGVQLADLVAPEHPIADEEKPPPVNPFQIPGWPPLRPLCPWQVPSHRDYYVPVGNSAEVFEEFVRGMDDLTMLLQFGQTVLVTGQAGCGKTALANRCADWVATRLAERGMTTEVMDLTASLHGQTQLTLRERMIVACDQLIFELQARLVLPKVAAEDLVVDRERPDRVFPRLPGALRDDQVLVILLPRTELPDEVIRYATLVRGRVLLIAESSYYNEDQIDNIVSGLASWMVPLVLQVHQLKMGDVHRFVSDRLARHGMRDFWQISVDAVDGMDRLLLSVAHVQRALYRVAESKIRVGLDTKISYVDVLESEVDFLRSGRRLNY